jgi:hypothetical protein
VLTKSIIGKQDPLILQEGEHAVRPMKHLSIQESKGATTHFQGITSFNWMEIRAFEYRVMQFSNH